MTSIGALSKARGSLEVGRDEGSLTVECEKEGYLTATEQVDSEFTGWTFGIILVGGGIGAVVDMASGANSEYPSLVKLDLIPASFADQADKRPIFFVALIAKTQIRFDEALVAIEAKCSSDHPAQCETRKAENEAKRKVRLEALKEARQSAAINKTDLDSVTRKSRENDPSS